MSRSTTIALAAALAAVTAIVAAPGAFAKDGDVRVKGTCTPSAITSKLKLSEEDGAIEVEFEVDQNRNGVTWQVKLYQNGALVTDTTATTQPPSGSFTVRRVLADTAGPDLIEAVATGPAGATCRAAASF